ncbi:unnamed protein product [Camellia sinensis]
MMYLWTGIGTAYFREPYFDYVGFVVPLSMSYIISSAADGPDLLAEELDLVRNMNLAVKEERYNDAAMWRDKLMKLLESRHEH